MSETLTPTEIRDLRGVAGMMIPASPEYKVPGADDDAIIADIVSTLGRDLGDVRQALSGLAELAGGAFADLSPERREIGGTGVSGARRPAGRDSRARHPPMLLPRRPRRPFTGP